jgi:(2Fe-2S) ferredoxin
MPAFGPLEYLKRRNQRSEPLGQYRYHIFVCTSGKTCPLSNSEKVHKTLKKAVSEAGLKAVVRVNHAGCMNQCGHGPMVVVYPEDTWYCGVDEEGARAIVNQHLLHGNVVEKYRYHAPPGDNKLVE